MSCESSHWYASLDLLIRRIYKKAAINLEKKICFSRFEALRLILIKRQISRVYSTKFSNELKYELNTLPEKQYLDPQNIEIIRCIVAARRTFKCRIQQYRPTIV